MLNQYNHYLHDPGYLPKDLARYENATPASVLKLAQSLTPNSRVVVHCVPGEKVLHDVPKRPEPQVAQTNMPGGPGNDEWRNTPPKPRAEKAPHLPSAKEFVLKNGMKVYLVEQHHLPVIAAQVTVLRGSDSNPVDKPGLASFTAKMLSEGTEKRTAPQLADDVAQIGARLDANSTADASLVRTSGLTKNSDRMFDLLSDVMLHPAFRQEEIERQRKLRLTELLQQNDDPNTLASKFFYHAVYGAGSPYGYLETGTVEATKATTRDDITRFYASGYGPKNAALVVSGDITEARLKGLAEKYFGGWTGTASPSKPPQVSSTLARHIMIVDMPGSPQSVLRIGQVGLERNNPDYVPVTLMNRILGGMFSSRINLNLREAHGYTYGAFSAFAFRRGAGPFYVGSMVRTDVTAPAVKEVFNELSKMRASAVTPEELAMAKEKETQALPGMFEVASNTASTISNLFVYNLPLDYYRTLPAKIEAVDAAEVQNMATKHLTPDKMVVVIAGYREKIEPELKKLELGPTEAQDAEGKPISEKPAVPGK
jgi:zinc protease